MLDTITTAEDSSANVSEFDIILPCQFFGQIKTDPAAQPEKRLMLAIVEDAIATFYKCLPSVTQRQRQLLKEVEEWFASADTAWPFSFQNICAALDLNVDYVRSGLDRVRARQLTPQKGLTLSNGSSFRRINGRPHTLSAYEGSCSRQSKHKAT